MTYPTTGYTRETDERTKLRNEVKACIQSYRELKRNFYSASFDGSHEQDIARGHVKNAYYNAVNAIQKYREYRIRQLPPMFIEAVLAEWDAQHPADNATLHARLEALNAEMAENPTMERALAIIDEIAEICNALQRDGDDGRFDDIADARREARFGVGL